MLNSKSANSTTAQEVENSSATAEKKGNKVLKAAALIAILLFLFKGFSSKPTVVTIHDGLVDVDYAVEICESKLELINEYLMEQNGTTLEETVCYTCEDEITVFKATNLTPEQKEYIDSIIYSNTGCALEEVIEEETPVAAPAPVKVETPAPATTYVAPATKEEPVVETPVVEEPVEETPVVEVPIEEPTIEEDPIIEEPAEPAFDWVLIANSSSDFIESDGTVSSSSDLEMGTVAVPVED